MLYQWGGWGDEVLHLVYGISLSSQQISFCNTPYQFLEKLLNKMKEINTGLLEGAPRVLLSSSRHVWTLNPDYWKLLLDNWKPFYHFINEIVFRPAKWRLASRVPRETLDRVIERFSDNEQTRGEMRYHFNSQRYLTYTRLRDDLFINVHPSLHGHVMKIIEEEFSKVTLSKPELSKILAELDIEVESEVFHKLYEVLTIKPSLPYHLARELRLALIEGGVAVNNPYDVELAICRIKRLPLPIYVGDLNWVNKYSEDPDHLHLMIKFSWVTGTPGYVIRNKEEETLAPNYNYNSVHIQYPKVVIRDKTWQ